MIKDRAIQIFVHDIQVILRLMVLFLLILGWSQQELWGRFVGLNSNNLQLAMNRWSDEGAPVGSLISKSVSFLWKGNNSTVDGVMIAYLLLVGLLDIYSR